MLKLAPFLLVALSVGCSKPPRVHMVNSAVDAYKCGPDQGAYLTTDGEVAVCMSARTAEFVMCAQSLGGGEVSKTSNTSLGAKVGGAGYSAEANQTIAETWAAKESASAEVLRARAYALRVCARILDPQGSIDKDPGTAKVPLNPASPTPSVPTPVDAVAPKK